MDLDAIGDVLNNTKQFSKCYRNGLLRKSFKFSERKICSYSVKIMIDVIKEKVKQCLCPTEVEKDIIDTVDALEKFVGSSSDSESYISMSGLNSHPIGCNICRYLV